MTNPNFLTTSDLSTFQPVSLEGRPVLGAENYSKLEAYGLDASILVADLFAEPALGPSSDQGMRTAAWYARLSGTPRPLGELADEERQQAEANLCSKLAALESLLMDPEVGPLLGRALLVPDLDSVYVVDNQAVLINWGMIPREVGDDEGRQASHFRTTLGNYSNYAVPWSMSASAPMPASSAPSQISRSEPRISVGTERVLPTPHTEVSDQRAVGTPWYRSAGFIAFYTSLVFAAGVLIGWFLRPDAYHLGLPPGVDEQEVQKGINDSLRNEMGRLRQLLQGDACALPSGEYFNPQVQSIGADESDTGLQVPADSVPTTDGDVGAATADKNEATDGSARSEARPTIRDLLEKSVAMVLAPGQKSGSMGTGFFIGPDILVTNRHVIEKGDPNNLLVVSQQLGSAVHAKAVAQSPSSELYQRDYAVLRLEKPVAAATLALAPKVEKLSRIFLGGYPGALMQTDPQFEVMIKGDLSAAPEMVMSPGDVVVVQHPKGGVPVVVHTAFMLQGNSGGALLDTCGRVVGINTFISQDKVSGRGASWSLASSDLIDFLKSNNIPVRIDPEDCKEGVR